MAFSYYWVGSRRRRPWRRLDGCLMGVGGKESVKKMSAFSWLKVEERVDRGVVSSQRQAYLILPTFEYAVHQLSFLINRRELLPSSIYLFCNVRRLSYEANWFVEHYVYLSLWPLQNHGCQLDLRWLCAYYCCWTFSWLQSIHGVFE